jgi:hypothetical protein
MKGMIRTTRRRLDTLIEGEFLMLDAMIKFIDSVFSSRPEAITTSITPAGLTAFRVTNRFQRRT